MNRDGLNLQHSDGVHVPWRAGLLPCLVLDGFIPFGCSPPRQQCWVMAGDTLLLFSPFSDSAHLWFGVWCHFCSPSDGMHLFVQPQDLQQVGIDAEWQVLSSSVISLLRFILLLCFTSPVAWPVFRVWFAREHPFP